ncbi:beta-N-acetylhexosaminidase [Devosia sp. Leaf420]|uniref:glycoside hydrolase family 3 N-terminal domain-containing protein n=1 Tax=Devosia sp. Leaf420 TaxID=1736374 RepID=UPI000715EACD|nr:glycoside hydrolase family 3 N-terminal domain-containing protein [Devosia sp. Leaf420]KQT51501.1 beta-N-acetylhexosaminidase [Devosia sp. Leaf420]
MSTPLALFVGMPGLELSASEVGFFRDANPFGLFLFKRNLDNPEQIRRLVGQFRDAVGREDAPVYIDQEGGRVQRLDNGNWPLFRPIGHFGALAKKDLDLAKHALRQSTLAMGSMMTELGIGSGATPVVDLARAGTHDIISSRSFSADPKLVAELGRVVVDALLEVGSMPIIKHIPGYGRVDVDPHHDLPVVHASVDEMMDSDFLPFIRLKDSPWAMVAHLIFSKIDPDLPASISPRVCNLIRTVLNYDGVLITDCLTMDALSGSWSDRVRAALDAGYDIALHSQGDLAASEAAAKAARVMSHATSARVARAEQRLGNRRADTKALHAEVEKIFEENGFA